MSLAIRVRGEVNIHPEYSRDQVCLASRLMPNTVHFEAPQVVGQVVNLRADWQSAMRRYPTAAQDSILPQIQMIWGQSEQYWL